MDDEARSGARNRLRYIVRHYPGADFWMSQEGGLCQEKKRLFEQAWIAITDKAGFLAESATARFYLPKQLAVYIEEGLELGEAADKFFKSANSKQGIGAIGHLTDGLIGRADYYLPAAIIALSELKHKEWY
jgi:non-canonical (house-cleaning) NTP pyrophosphatase